MKKFIYSFMLISSVAMLTSCDHEFLGEKEDVGQTSMYDMSGEWYVSVQCMDADGNVVFEDEDFLEMGKFVIATSNVTANNTNQLIIQDNENLYNYSGGYFNPFRCKVDVDLASMSFECPDAEKYIYATVNYNDGTENTTYTTNNLYFTATPLANGDSVEFGGSYYFPEDMTCHFCYGEGTPNIAINIDSKGYDDYANDNNVEIWDGKVLKNAARQNNGTVCDSIVFNYRSDDYYFSYYANYAGYDHFRIQGKRYSGLAEND